MSKSQESPKIIVIGGGAAGVAAASRLLENGFTNVVVLEAKDYIGGRIKSVPFGDSFVDLGAESCHGEKNNVVFDLVKNLNVLTSDVSVPNFFYPRDRMIDTNLKNSLNEMFEKIYHREKRTSNGTLGDYLRKRYLECIENDFNDSEKEIAEEMLDVFRKLVMIHEGTFSWFNVANVSDYTACEGLLRWNWGNGQGYKTILDVLQANVSVKAVCQLRKDVVSIDWEWEDSVTVTCADGSKYRADHVILTMSLGVLKTAHGSLLRPPLPLSKSDAISRLQMEGTAKIFFYFPVRWWPDDFEGAYFVWPKKCSDFSDGPRLNGRSWVRDIVGLYPLQQNPNVLKMWFVGEMIPELEMCSEDTIVDGLMFVLQLFLGSTYPKIDRPTKVIRHNWYSDEHFRGTYSFQGLLSHKGPHSDAFELSLPLFSNDRKPRILFAGEATHPKFYSTVHGAIETGFREAERLISLYK